MDEVDIRAGIIHDLIPVFTDYNAGMLDLDAMLKAAIDIEFFIFGGEDVNENDLKQPSDGWPQIEPASPGYERDRKTFEDFQRDAQHQFDYDKRYCTTGGAAKNLDKGYITR